MRILVINSGSSSIKYKVFQDHKVIHQDILSNISDFNKAIIELFDLFFKKMNLKIDAVGHRVVHGGENFHQPTLIDDQVIQTIESLIPLAPLHNPSNLQSIKIIQKRFPSLPQVAVFDTSFHQTMPPSSYLYALPLALYEKHHIRRYGFHGSSHEYVAQEAASYIQKDLSSLNLITIHLGNGSSICAIKNGKSYDTSMGFTPLEGLVMGTRCGDIDPQIVTYLQSTLGYDSSTVENILNKQSGLLGLCGESDFQKILKNKENPIFKNALNIFTERILGYIGNYYLRLGKVDAIIFTGGIGENSSFIREKICERLQTFNIFIDKNLNSQTRKENFHFQTTSSYVKLLCINTNEEYQIYNSTIKVLKIINR